MMNMNNMPRDEYWKTRISILGAIAVVLLLAFVASLAYVLNQDALTIAAFLGVSGLLGVAVVAEFRRLNKHLGSCYDFSRFVDDFECRS